MNPMCGSVRVVDGERLQCNRRLHSIQQKHRALTEDMSVILWEGAASADIAPRMADVNPS